MMTDSSRPVTGGVDTHKDVHVAAVVDPLGAVLGTAAFDNSTPGYELLHRWLTGFGAVERVGVEGTGSYGAGLARFLTATNVEVVEINRPDRHARRREGKSDPLDAIAAARGAASGRHAGVPKTGDGIVESIRMLRACRRGAVRARTSCANQTHSLIDTAPAELRDTWRDKAIVELVEIAERTAGSNELATPAASAVWSLQCLARRWTFLNIQVGELDSHLARLVPVAAPELIELQGLGPDTAGALLVAAGDNPGRLRSEASFAAMCGVNPLPASSGKTTRHRLNRSGNREANQALWRIAMVRMSHDPATRAYVERRTKEGRSKREILRCLKRYIAREVYHHLPRPDLA
jgi:transposase